MVTIWPCSSMTTPVPSRVEPRLELLRAPAIAFIFTRTMAEIISWAALSDCAPSSFDWTPRPRGSVCADCDVAATPNKMAASSAAARTDAQGRSLMVPSCGVANAPMIVILIGDEFQSVPADSSRMQTPTRDVVIGIAGTPGGAVSGERRTRLFLNLGHTLDHLFMLIFPTVVLAMSTELRRPYAELLPLSLGGFIAFGAFSIPSGWLADRWSRFGMMVVFFFGIGTASILTGLARSPFEIAAGLTLIGAFAAIYHPVGTTMLVANASPSQLGRTLGANGVYGNLGVAFSALLAGAMADTFGWRWAFIVPGLLSICMGALFARLQLHSAVI